MIKDPFPPLIDLEKAGWPLSDAGMFASVTSKNNQIVGSAATAMLAVGDHIYDFGVWCDRSIGNAP